MNEWAGGGEGKGKEARERYGDRDKMIMRLHRFIRTHVSRAPMDRAPINNGSIANVASVNRAIRTRANGQKR